jgi:hypothetical protein
MPKFWFWRRKRPKKAGVETVRHRYEPSEGGYAFAIACMLVAGSILSSRRAREELKRSGQEFVKAGFAVALRLRRGVKSARISEGRHEAWSRESV